MTLDATVADADANSYLTVADADAFADADLGPDVDAWNAATDADKERALQLATADIDAAYGRISLLFTADQALVFPRDVDASAGTPFIPAAVARATWEQAKYRFANQKLFAAARARRARGLASFSDDDGSGTMSLHPEMEGLSTAAQRLLGTIPRTNRTTLMSVPLRSATYPTPYGHRGGWGPEQLP